MNNKEKLAYAAGIIDGEGCVGMQSAGRKKPKTFTIEVKMTDKPTIDFLHALFKCGHIAARPSTNPRWKDQWRWRICGKKALIIIDQLSPYLRIKHK